MKSQLPLLVSEVGRGRLEIGCCNASAAGARAGGRCGLRGAPGRERARGVRGGVHAGQSRAHQGLQWDA
eukprot:scaffold127362_cov69-Phaeocystis_antarctica.AAC.1